MSSVGFFCFFHYYRKHSTTWYCHAWLHLFALFLSAFDFLSKVHPSVSRSVVVYPGRSGSMRLSFSFRLFICRWLCDFLIGSTLSEVPTAVFLRSVDIYNCDMRSGLFILFRIQHALASLICTWPYFGGDLASIYLPVSLFSFSFSIGEKWEELIALHTEECTNRSFKKKDQWVFRLLCKRVFTSSPRSSSTMSRPSFAASQNKTHRPSGTYWSA